MTTKPTPEMVKEFNMKFTTTKPSVKSMTARK